MAGVRPGPKGGLMAQTVCSLDDGDRLQSLQSTVSSQTKAKAKQQG
jgi:hypothetical protein